MQIGERAALMFTAICRDLDRVFQRVGLLRPGLICSDQRADTDNKVACSKVRSGQSRDGAATGGIRLPEVLGALVFGTFPNADPNCRLWRIANMAIRQSASEGRALTISVSARFPLGPVICPDQLEQALTFAARHLQRYQFRLYRQRPRAAR